MHHQNAVMSNFMRQKCRKIFNVDKLMVFQSINVCIKLLSLISELICTKSAKLTTISINSIGRSKLQLVDCNDYTIGNDFRRSTPINCDGNESMIPLFESKCRACCKFYVIVNNGNLVN